MDRNEVVPARLEPEHGAAIKAGAFISHIWPEHPVALVLKTYIEQAFQGNVQVFVSSDNRSIPGGEGWWQFIRETLKLRSAVLVLLSDESCDKEWINYEAGVADGSGAKVIPVAIKGFTYDKLGFPVKGFQGRYVGDLEGILLDITDATKLVPSRIDKASYLAEIQAAEDRLIYKKLVFQPVRTHYCGMPNVMFEIENTGNADLDLLFAEVHFPQTLLASNFTFPEAPPLIEVDQAGGYLFVRYYSIPPSERWLRVRRLEPTITRSMGVRRLRDLRFPLRDAIAEPDAELVVRYQLHARDYETVMEEVRFVDITESPEKCD